MATIDNYQININVTGDGQVKNATNNVNNFDRAINKAAADQKNLQNANKNSADSFEKLNTKLKAFTALFVGERITEFAKKILDTADANLKMADTFGLSVEKVLELQAAFEKTGVGTEGASRALTTLAVKVNELKSNVPGAINAFDALGLSYQDIVDLPLDQVLVKVTEAVQAQGGSVEALAAAHELLGKTGTGKSLKEFNDRLRQVTGTMGETARATETLAEAQQKLEILGQDLKNSFTRLLAPIAEFFNKIEIEGPRTQGIIDLVRDSLLAVAGIAASKGFSYIGALFAGMGVSAKTAATGSEIAAVALGNMSRELTNAQVRAAYLGTTISRLGTVQRQLVEAQMAVNAAQEKFGIDSLEAGVALEKLEQVELRAAEVANIHAEAIKNVNVQLESGALLGTKAAAATEGVAAAEATATVATTGLARALNTVGAAISGIFSFLGRLVGKLFYAYTIFMLIKDGIEIAFGTDAIDKFILKVDNLGRKLIGLKERVDTGEWKGGVGHMGKTPEAGAAPDLEGPAKLAAENQLKLDAKINDNLERRMRVQVQLAGQTEAYKNLVLQTLDFEFKKSEDLLRLKGDIAVKEKELSLLTEKTDIDKKKQEIDALQKQYVAVKNRRDVQTQANFVESKALDIAAQRNRMYSLQQDIIAATDAQLRDNARLTMTENERALADADDFIEALIKEEVAAREAALGFDLAGNKIHLTTDEVQALRNELLNSQGWVEYNTAVATAIGNTESFAQGAKKSFADIQNSLTPFKFAADAVNQVWADMGKSIDTLVETGKFSFKDLARSIVGDLTKMILKAELLQLIMASLGMVSPTAASGFASLVGIPGHAAGGSVQPNQPTIVGEKGPEMFVPKSAGTIVPNNQLGMAGGPSNVTNNYYNINAVDAKSVARLFTENRQALLGASKQAEKELPYRVR